MELSYALLGAVIIAAVAVILYLRFRRRPTAEELERRRRELIQTTGKIGDGEILDVDGSLVMYSYSVAGVGYTVSQDISGFAANLPDDRMDVLGPVRVKFLPRNPANSIVVCEVWTGLRRAPNPPRGG